MDIADDNKRNIMFFDGPSVRKLYAKMDEWQKLNRKRFHSISVQKDGERFCVALTNPTEVMITDRSGEVANVSGSALQVRTV